jgi:hypothetical protein
MNPLDEAIKDLTRILGIMDVGTADRPRQMAAITVTIERIKSWRNVHVPKAGERGGTKTLEDVDEAKEDGPAPLGVSPVPGNAKTATRNSTATSTPSRNVTKLRVSACSAGNISQPRRCYPHWTSSTCTTGYQHKQPAKNSHAGRTENL